MFIYKQGSVFLKKKQAAATTVFKTSKIKQAIMTVGVMKLTRLLS